MKNVLSGAPILILLALLGWGNYRLANIFPTGWAAVGGGLVLFLLVSGIWFRDLIWTPGAYLDKDENFLGILVLFKSVLTWFISVVLYGLFYWLYPDSWVLITLAGLMWFAFWIMAGVILLSCYFSIRYRSESLESSA